MAWDGDLFLFGDDLDAVLEALEADNDVNGYFDEAVMRWVKRFHSVSQYPAKFTELRLCIRNYKS